MNRLMLPIFVAVTMSGCGQKDEAVKVGPGSKYATEAIPDHERPVIRKWKPYQDGTLFHYEALFPDSQPDSQQLYLSDRIKGIVTARQIGASQHNVEMLKKGKFVSDLGCGLVYARLSPRLPNEQYDAVVAALITECLPIVKDRKASSPRAVTWAGHTATETVYEAEADKPKVTIRDLRLPGLVYIGHTIEGVRPVPKDVKLFFDSFKLLPANK